MDTTVLPNDWIALLAVVFVLGLKHGIDPDHLATIDGLTRFNSIGKPGLSRWSGFLFSLGHGLVVMLAAIFFSLAAGLWQVPVWLEDTGAWISIFFLLVLGVTNFYAFLVTAPGQPVALTGFKSRWLGQLTRASHPLVIASIGALFAISFDTMSQTALFAMAGSIKAGWMFAGALGAVFMLGMMVADGVNGLWISRLINQSDRRALIASRIMSMAIASVSIAMALLGMAKYFSASFNQLTDTLGLQIGISVIVSTLLAFMAGWLWVALKNTPRT